MMTTHNSESAMKMLISNAVSYKIQILRGLSIVAVVLVHNTPAGLTRVILRPFLNPSVCVFLFLSGILSDTRI